MSTPTNGQAPHNDPPPFVPDPHFAVQAQQEEIDDLRTGHATEIKTIRNRNTYLRALVLQIQAEAQHSASLMMGRVQSLEVELEDLRRRLFQAPQSAPEPPRDPRVDEELDENLDVGRGPLKHLAGANDTDIETTLDNQVAYEGLSSEEMRPAQVAEKIMDEAKFGDNDPIPAPQPGIPVDNELKDINLAKSDS